MQQWNRFLVSSKVFRACASWVAIGLAVAGTNADAAIPLDGVSKLAAGSNHNCALTSGGAIKCWGSNGNGQLGVGNTSDWSTAVKVTGLVDEGTAVGANVFHTCALVTGGGVKCWGGNGSGQLGDGSTTTRLTAVSVSGLVSGVTALAVGFEHTCALTSSGGVKCWGTNGSGQLGDGSRTGKLTAVDVSGLSSGVVAITAGGNHTCALTSSGGVKCWGGGFMGHVIETFDLTYTTPVDVAGLTSGVNAISTGSGHTCALTSSGGLKCWGDNQVGQLGDGSYLNRPTAVDVIGLTSGVASVAAGASHTCAVMISGGVKCWGNNGYGELGDGTITYRRPTAVDVIALTSSVTEVAVGNQHTCALTSGGRVKCWGGNYSGQLGDGSSSLQGSITPVDVMVLNTPRRLINLSTRGNVLTGDKVMISGFIVNGSSPKKVLIRAVGPNLSNYGVAGVLADPKLDLYAGQSLIASNDDWGGAANAAEIQATTLAPVSAKESAILTTLQPNVAYTAVVSGTNSGTGVGIVEAFEVDQPDSPLINLSSRGYVQTGGNVMIGGFVVTGDAPQTVLIRGVGPNLANSGVGDVLADPQLTLYSGQTIIAANNDWGASANVADIQATGLAPAQSKEAAILITLNPGPYTVILSGVGNTSGVGIVEVFAR